MSVHILVLIKGFANLEQNIFTSVTVFTNIQKKNENPSEIKCFTVKKMYLNSKSEQLPAFWCGIGIGIIMVSEKEMTVHSKNENAYHFLFSYRLYRNSYVSPKS